MTSKTDRRRRVLTLALAPLLVPAAGVAWPVPAAAAAAAAVDDLAAVTAPRLDMAAAARLYRAAVLGEGVEALYRRLDTAIAAATGAPARARLLLVRAVTGWQSGEGGNALADVDRALALAPDLDGYLLKARLLDARGDVAQATALYARAEAASRDPGETAFLRLRLASMAAGDDPAPLTALARQSPPAVRARIAAVVALSGDAKDALALDADGTGTPDYAREVRRAAWALAAGDAAAARDHGWRAVGIARDVTDRRYALALTIEALRDQGRLADAPGLFDTRPGDPDFEQARIDVLIELRRHDEAIAVVRRSADPEVRRRLLGIFDVTGRTADAEAEYRRRIADSPRQPEWYASLAALRLGQGDEAGALDAYRQLFANNRGRIDVLVRAARQMVAVGLGAQATAMMADLAEQSAFAVPARFFLFDTYLDGGRTDDAAAQLSRIRTATPVGSAVNVDLADAYERLGRPDTAFAILRGMEGSGREADYDRQVRLAQLAGTIGQHDDALARWRRLRATTTLPARTGYLDNQIVRTARATDRLDAIADDVAARLAAGTVADADLDLLVRIRIDQNRRADAQAAVERYVARSGQPEAARLARLRGVYARLGAGERYRQTLRRLVAVDPARAETYLRELVSDAVRDPDRTLAPAERAAAIDRLLAELQAVPGADRAGAQAFAAGVYAAAALDERAIGAYRRAMAADPRDGDKLLQLTTLLKTHGRFAQAAATVQFAIETAAGEDDLVGAVGALIDLYEDAGVATAPSAAQARHWARRIVLERIASAGASARLYGLVADLSEQSADFDMQLRAIDASLPFADEQRGAVLRQLVTLTSGGDGTSGPALGDDGKKAIYGRRLIALRREVPPSVYADIAGALLARRDVPGAERALSMMTDIGGLTNLDQLKGEVYLREGYVDAASAALGRALVQDQDNFALLVKTSILRERQGRMAVANGWYRLGLRMLIARQSQRDPVGRGAAGQEALRYYDTLLEGVLATWPADPAVRARIAADLAATLAAALPRAGQAASVPFDGNARLALAVDAIRRIAAFDGDTAAVAAMERAVAPFHGDDPAYRRQAQRYRDLTGSRVVDPASVALPGWAIRDLRVQAADTGRVDIDLALAMAADDRPAIAARVAAAITGRTASATSPILYDLVLATLSELPREAFATLVLAPLEAAPVRDAVLFDLFRTRPAALARVEEIAGRRMLADDALVAMILAHGDDPLPASRLAYEADGGVPAILDGIDARFGVDTRLALFTALVDRTVTAGVETGWQSALAADLLKRPLTPAQQERLVAAMTRMLATPRGAGAGARSSAMAVPRLLLLDTERANQPALIRVARGVAQAFPDGRHLPELLEAYFAGDRARAFALLDAVRSDTAATFDAGNYTIDIVTRYFADERRAAIAAFLARDGQDAAEVDRFYRRMVLPEINGSAPRSEELAASYRKLVSIDPGNDRYVAGLLDVYWRQGAYGPFADLLAKRVAERPADRDAATSLQLAYRIAGQPDRALAVARAAGVDADDVAWLVGVSNRASASPQTGLEPTMGSVFTQLLRAYRTKFPAMPAVVALTKREQAAARPSAAGGTEAPLTALRSASPADAAAMLRGIWRSTPATPGEHGRASPRQLLLMTFPDPAAPPAAQAAAGAPRVGPLGPDQSLLPVMTTNPGVSDEIATFLSVMEPEERQREQTLYDLVAHGMVAQQRARARLDALAATLMAGDIDGHSLQLLTALANALDMPLDAAQQAALTARLRRMPILSGAWRVALARWFARSGRYDVADDLLGAAAMQALYPAPDELSRGFDAARAIGDIVAELATWHDVDAARRSHARLTGLVAGQRGGSAEAARGLTVPPLSSATAR